MPHAGCSSIGSLRTLNDVITRTLKTESTSAHCAQGADPIQTLPTSLDPGRSVTVQDIDSRLGDAPFQKCQLPTMLVYARDRRL